MLGCFVFMFHFDFVIVCMERISLDREKKKSFGVKDGVFYVVWRWSVPALPAVTQSQIKVAV